MAQPAPAVDPELARLNALTFYACNDAIFQCGAVELAFRLLGQCLYFHDSKIAVRILETEGFPHGDAVYNKRFIDGGLNFDEVAELKGGTLLAWNPNHYVGEKAEFKDLYITAGPPGCGDLVHIRSCEPLLGDDEIMKNRKNPTALKTRKNLLIGPTRVSEGVGAESWPDEPNLYEAGGVQLFVGQWLPGEKAKRGKRILQYNYYHGCEGTNSLFRFALDTKNRYLYSTACGGLHYWTEA
ncbi:hypothetical protein M758_5G069900 [Ceratodon purpureus]|nr:hypothetical protein M758_5G069900 [Ceratodon purpureus]